MNGTTRINSVARCLVSAVVIVMTTSAVAQAKFSVIHNFGGPGDGAGPQATLVLDKFGVLYGTTFNGGAGKSGTVFEISRRPSGGWAETVLYSFMGRDDGAFPAASLILDTNGNLYGTTQNGGTVNKGVAFELTRSQSQPWPEIVLHSFGSVANDALSPQSAVVMDKSGTLFGTGIGGHFGFGAVYRLTNNAGVWTENTLHSFDEVDGYIPHDLLMGNTGSLYGTARLGGNMDHGVVFAVTPRFGGLNERTIHFFQGAPGDGNQPQSGLSQGADGALYGTTHSGGANDEGIVYRLTPARAGGWTASVLYSFSGGSDGGFPQAGVVIDRTGGIYGTAIAGGDAHLGVVFKLTPQADGSYVESVLHSFTGGNDGSLPDGGLVLDSSGTLFGTASAGGRSNLGVVFKL